MKITTVFFDLDGTLLPMDQEFFTKKYLKLLAAKMAPHGYEPQKLVDTIWAGTAAMVKNDGSRKNEEVFWEKFAQVFGEESLADRPVFDEFYRKEFQETRDSCGYNPKAKEAVSRIKEMCCRTVLATNPIFPLTAQESRIRWAGLEPEDFVFCSAYENIGYCKPNPCYYEDIRRRLNLEADECCMVGNDVREDMIAETVGMPVFLLTDCLINREGKDISAYPHGGFEQLLEFLSYKNE